MTRRLASRNPLFFNGSCGMSSPGTKLCVIKFISPVGHKLPSSYQSIGAYPRSLFLLYLFFLRLPEYFSIPQRRPWRARRSVRSSIPGAYEVTNEKKKEGAQKRARLSNPLHSMLSGLFSVSHRRLCAALRERGSRSLVHTYIHACPCARLQLHDEAVHTFHD